MKAKHYKIIGIRELVNGRYIYHVTRNAEKEKQESGNISATIFDTTPRKLGDNVACIYTDNRYKIIEI